MQYYVGRRAGSCRAGNFDLYELLSKLSDHGIVLDLGSGEGSFQYDMCPARIVAVDVTFEEKNIRRNDPRISHVCAKSESLPLPDSCVDAVVCHHTLEHFGAYEKALSEIGRVLRPEGWLWIAVPNGYGFDETLYRFVFSGGGHVNRFRRDALLQDVRRTAGLELVADCDLFSGFHYLKKPSPAQLRYYPRVARLLARVPNVFLDFGILSINVCTRILDRALGSRYSQYGWGFVFSRERITVSRLPSYFNVCRRCGSGFAFRTIKAGTILGLGFYHCPQCGELNSLIRPPKALD